MPIAYAVAASSAVPGLLSPISLMSRAGTCGFEIPAYMEEGLGMRGTDPRRYYATRNFVKFADPGKRFVHLVDGGISDNLGLRAGLDSASAVGGLEERAEIHDARMPKHLVVVGVNAETAPPHKLDLSAASPGLAAMVGAVSGSQIRRHNVETLIFAKDAIANWVHAADREGVGIMGHVIGVSFAHIKDADERCELEELPTSFSLPDEQVDALRAPARELLEESPEFQHLLEVLGQP